MLTPFATTGPAIISFSGGRTSAYMLHEIIQAHGGQLPDDVQVAFANTGKEREETLRFVYECGVRLRVNIHWLEWRDAKPCFEEVGFNGASRDGEPFEALIKKKKRLPNWRERWCTGFLKVKVLTAFAASLGWKPGEYAEVIGLRHDEGMRIFRGLENAEKDGRKVLYPLSRAKVVKQQIMAFWKNQDFDLQLNQGEGNCDLCFEKSRETRKRIIARQPHLARWWHRQEVEQDGFFDRRDRVSDLAREVRENPDLLDAPIDEEEFDTECGLSCGYTPEASE